MNILAVTPSYYPAFGFGGPIQSVHLLNKSLVEKNYAVDVLTTNAGLSQEQILNTKEKSKDGWNDVDGVSVKYLKYWGYEHYNFSIQFIGELKKIIRNYDIVHITSVWNFPVIVAAYNCVKYKIPYIISPRGVFHKEAITNKSSIIKKIYFNFIAKYYLKRASAIHYTSELEKEESELILKHKNSFVIPNGIALSEISNDLKPEIFNKFDLSNKNYILFLGRIHKIKGLELLISAFNNIAGDYKDLFLVIVGDQSISFNHSIIELIQKYNLTQRVIFTGQVSGDDKWSLYKNALMFVLPSYSENFGMSVVEAMAYSCPIVISDKVGIYKEVLENLAGIVVQTNATSVEEGILRLLENENLRSKIAKNGKAMVEKYYDITKVAGQMIDKYDEIINSYKH